MLRSIGFILFFIFFTPLVSNDVRALDITHYPDGINMSGGYVSGWSCSIGNSSPTTVKIYASNFSSSQCKNFREGVSGCLVGSTTANLQSESGVTNACGTPNHRFKYYFPDSLKDGKVHRIFLESVLGNQVNEFNYYPGMARDFFYYDKSLEKIIVQDSNLTPITNLDPSSRYAVIQNCDWDNNKLKDMFINNTYHATEIGNYGGVYPKMCSSFSSLDSNYSFLNMFGLPGTVVTQKGVNDFTNRTYTHSASVVRQFDGYLYVTNLYPYAVQCSAGSCEFFKGLFTLAPTFTSANSTDPSKYQIWKNNPNAVIEVSADLSFPYGSRSQDNRLYTDLVVLLADVTKTGGTASSSIWVAPRVFDLNYPIEPQRTIQNAFHIDFGPTPYYIVNGNLNSPHPFITIPQSTNVSTSSTYGDLRKFVFLLNKDNLVDMVDQLNQIKPANYPEFNRDYRDWVVVGVNLTHEFNSLNSYPKENSYLTMFSKNITLSYYDTFSFDCDDNTSSFDYRDITKALSFYFNGGSPSSRCDTVLPTGVDYRDLLKLLDFYFSRN